MSGAKSVDVFDVNTILAEAKTKGYKYKKSELGQHQDFQYCFKYKEWYFKTGLLDQAFSIIDDGKEAEVYYNGEKGLLFIKTSIGIAGILPFNAMENIEKKTVIEAAVCIRWKFHRIKKFRELAIAGSFFSLTMWVKNSCNMKKYVAYHKL